MKHYLLPIALFLLLLNPFCAEAFHYLGGEISYTNVKGANNQPTDNYKWRVVLYFDKSIQEFAPSTYSINICKNSNGNIETSVLLNKINPLTYLHFPESECPVKEAQDMIEYAVYESNPINHANLTDPHGYYAIYTLCCVSGYRNINSANYSAMNYLDFKPMGPTSIARFNSSPQFSKPIMQYLKVGKLYTLDWSATDPDGDSLVYVIDTPKLGAGVKANWNDWEFKAGYSATGNVADGNPDFRINSQTGFVTFLPVLAGSYLISTRVDEYRKINGVPVKIGESSRELMISPYVPLDVYPVLYDSLRNTKVYDTLNVTSPIVKTVSFAAMDPENDTLFMKIIPDKSNSSNNILDTNLIKVTWKGMSGQAYSGVDAENYIIKRKSTSISYLTIYADSNHISTLPYKFIIVCYKKNCPYLLADTVHYELIISGSKCYKMTSINIAACDSFVASNGKTYFQSIVLIDTVNTTVGCNLITVRNINIIPSPIANFDNLNIYVTDTSKTYTYTVDSQSNATYQWTVSSLGNIISGANTNSIDVKWNTDTAMQSIACYVNRGNCFDSISSPIVVSHIVGIHNAIRTIKVYPNPVNDVLMFNTTENLNRALISIYNTIGQKITETVINNNYADVSNVAHGAYTFTVMLEGKLYRGKFVK